MLVLGSLVALVALVWGTVAIVRGSLVWGCLTYLIVAACFGVDFLTLRLGVQFTLDRVALVGLVAAFCVQTRLGCTDPKPLYGCDIFLILLLVCLAISTFTHDFLSAGPGSASGLWRLFAGYLVPAAIYWIARQAPHSERGIRAIQLVLIVFGIYLAVTGVLEVSNHWSLVFPRHIANPKLGLHFGRARGPMLTSVTYGLYLAVAILAGWVAWPRLRRLPQLLLLLILPVALAGVYVSYTRSVWMGALLGLVIVMGLILEGRLRALLLGGIVATALMVSITNLDRMASFQRETSASETRDSTEMRGSFAYISWLMFQDQPLWGCGFGHFREAKWAFVDDHSSNFNLRAIRDLVHHNTLLSLLTETGMLGFCLFLAVWIAWLQHAWELLRSPFSPAWARGHGALLLGAFGAYFCQLLFHELSFTTLDNGVMFFLAGVTVGLRPVALGQRRHSTVPLLRVQANAGPRELASGVGASLCSRVLLSPH